MKLTLTNPTGTKAVNISNPTLRVFNCFYVQIYKGEETVLQAKTFTTFKGAKNWANKVLN